MAITVMITGSEGFIGSNMLKYWVNHYPFDTIVRVDSFTYAARPTLLTKEENKRTILENINICDQAAVAKVMQKYRPDIVLHYAAESHVCRSITGPKDFVQTNVLGTFNLLEEFRGIDNFGTFVHISTDEVFGELELEDPSFNEDTPLRPRSPYAASKAASDMIALSYFHTYGLDVRITNSSNVFGPNQHEEKLIPKAITKLLDDEPMTIYQGGQQVRNWLYVDDHCKAIDKIAHDGVSGERYCIGGEFECSNLELVNTIHELLLKNHAHPHPLRLDFINARPTDDFRYSIDSSKLKSMGWSQNKNGFRKNLSDTIKWYYDRH